MNTNDALKRFGEEDILKCLEETDVTGKTFGNYRIGREIGGGGMGRIYEAQDVSLNRPVVVKMIKFHSKGLDHRKMMAARFHREALAACRVLHQNVAVTFAFLEEGGQHLLVMEKIDGRTLRDEIVKDGRSYRALDPKRAIGIVIDVLRGLEAIHDAGIIHRDLKPGNVMLTHKDDQVKIVDFGLGKAVEPSGDPAFDMTLTQHDVPIGSPPYMAPEQCRSLPVDARTDIYAVGVILFQLLAGKLPFQSANMMEVYDMHRSAPLPPLFVTGAGPALPALQAIVRKAMAKEPGDRYASAAAMRAALEAVDFAAKPAPVAVKPVAKTGQRLLPFAALAAFVPIAALAVMSMRTPDAPAPRREAARTAPETMAAPAKTAEKSASSGIAIPPPPPPSVPTVAQGCTLYASGRTSDAITALKAALAKTPDDAEGLFCLCGAYVRQPESSALAHDACKAYRAHPDRSADKAKQADLWLRRLKR